MFPLKLHTIDIPTSQIHSCRKKADLVERAGERAAVRGFTVIVGQDE